MDDKIAELISEARKARDNAYAPYSKFRVGAAALGENGKIYAGCNVENVSYGLSVCAERAAVFAMVADGCGVLSALAVAASGEGAPPCGACRQVAAEFAKGDVPVLVCGDASIRRLSLSELLPESFKEFKADES